MIENGRIIESLAFKDGQAVTLEDRPWDNDESLTVERYCRWSDFSSSLGASTKVEIAVEILLAATKQQAEGQRENTDLESTSLQDQTQAWVRVLCHNMASR